MHIRLSTTRSPIYWRVLRPQPTHYKHVTSAREPETAVALAIGMLPLSQSFRRRTYIGAKDRKTLGHKPGLILLAVLVFLACGTATRADQIGSLTLSNCGASGTLCPAATYSFDVGSTSATLTIDVTGGVVAGTNNYITGVDLGFTSQTVNVTGFSSLPSGSWTNSDFTASLGSKGCGTNNGAFVCASGAGVQVSQGGEYTFTWTYDAIDLNQVDPANDIHIGANYGPHNGLIVSTSIAQQAPEPSSLLLLLGSLSALGLLALHRR